MGQLFDRWLESSKASTAERTFEERQRLVKNHLRPRVGGLKLAKVHAIRINKQFMSVLRPRLKALRHVRGWHHNFIGYSISLKFPPYGEVCDSLSSGNTS